MKNFLTLIKITQNNINKKRNQIQNLESQQKQLSNLIDNLNNDLNKQKQISLMNPEVNFIYSNYAKHNIDRQNILKNEIKSLNTQIDIAIEELISLGLDKKKYEIILENKKNFLKNEEKKKQDVIIDELIINQFNYNHKD